MRGKAFHDILSLRIIGITPAYAGKSRTREKSGLFERDHPRLCGEKAPNRAGKTVFLGSPPPMRGKVNGKRKQSLNYGITPAYAGKSFPFLKIAIVRQDHPRLCGEKL